ncbi:serine/threonine protein kinase [Paenibacillus sp. MMS18-CY102]|uniref:serine/threonine protein kinase n=1 Tax=Paenibacillus sp. MMS18-CY102 TaxID=2682849 RepID=UPI0013653B8B|nr:serine/threonine protein kinase [Paenibacillus sp. MMS18-CY102]MWC30639.1 serine/threonine protein kinase [Paenibacillus sp. MMS18-CY102]
MNQQPVTYTMDKVSFELQQPHDFTWLQSLGTVFCAFGQQDSGNISFGIENNGTKIFVKYAGCRPMSFSGNPIDAINRLRAAMPLYTILENANLIKLLDHYETGNGYAAIFEWFPGECLHSHWLFAGIAKHTHPDSPFYKFKQLPIAKRLQSLNTIYEFHEYVEASGYVAVDFYDGSLLYDFSMDEMKICDIDFYRPAPSVNDMGEGFWGATRSKSPEEFTLGAPLDARTNVFTMGAIAFGLLGGEMDHSFSQWEGNRSLYEVALRAVSRDRELRYPTIQAFKQAWDAGVNS